MASTASERPSEDEVSQINPPLPSVASSLNNDEPMDIVDGVYDPEYSMKSVNQKLMILFVLQRNYLMFINTLHLLKSQSVHTIGDRLMLYSQNSIEISFLTRLWSVFSWEELASSNPNTESAGTFSMICINVESGRLTEPSYCPPQCGTFKILMLFRLFLRF